MRSIRIMIAAVCLLAGILLVSFMQHRFDRADLKKGIAAIQQKFPEVKNCRSEVASRARGLVQVSCEGRQWVVDVVKGVIGEEYGDREMLR